MDAKSIYLTYRILLDQKLSLEKIKSCGDNRYFDFQKSLQKASSSIRKRRRLLYNFFHNWFFVSEE